MTTNHSEMIPKPHFMETAAEYIDMYEARLELFQAELKATEAEGYEWQEWNFVTQELAELEGPFRMLDLARSDNDPGVTPRYDFSEDYQAACYAVHHIGYKKAYYANKKKIAFLKGKSFEVHKGQPPVRMFFNKWDIPPIIKEIETEPKRPPEFKPQNGTADDSTPLIDPTKEAVLSMWEQNIQDEIQQWRDGEDKEGCAAFCNYLLERKIFNTNNLSDARNYALARFGINIKSSLDKIRRPAQAELRKRKTDAIVRKATGKKYGKL